VCGAVGWGEGAGSGAYSPPWADGNDCGAGEGDQTRLHQRIGTNAGEQLRMPGFILRFERGLTLLRRYHNDPTSARPIRKLPREITDQRPRRGWFEGELKLAVLETNQPNVALERRLC